ncbi:MAG: asparagine--tRNA ligase [Vampirovibrionales bacterium]
MSSTAPTYYNRVLIRHLANHVGQAVELYGWLYNRRSSGKIHFLEIRDGSGLVQGVMGRNDVDEATFALADHTPQESAVKVSGTVSQHPKTGAVELHVNGFEVLSQAGEYPISHKEHGVGFLMDNRHLWLRSSRQHAALTIRSELCLAIHQYFHQHGFVQVDAPIFTPNACEGTTNLFETTYFDDKADLTQSGQLYMEAAAAAFGRVYCFGPTFRAEKSKTRRHLTEFWMVEPEMAYATLDDVMDVAEDFMVYLVGHVLTHCRPELATLERDVAKLEAIVKPFPRISYDEALELLKQHGSEEQQVPWGEDFGGDEETVISNQFDRPVFIHRYPTQCKAFYMKEDPTDPKKSLSVDMIGPEGYGELIGGGQREDDLAVLEQKIAAHGLPKEDFEWFLDVRRYGTFSHGGFGLGVERTVAWLCGLHHVRETIPFPRLLDRLKP